MQHKKRIRSNRLVTVVEIRNTLIFAFVTRYRESPSQYLGGYHTHQPFGWRTCSLFSGIRALTSFDCIVLDGTIP